tara:strand:- start:6738 stop:7364 length:627 start_codon:yes stop_codon:yes gene_type:complete
MKIYFDGCSWTWGAELENREDRFSKLIADHYNAEECNYSECCSSNNRIVRRLLDTDISSYDKVFIQMTLPSRTEYYDGEVWKQVNLGVYAPKKSIFAGRDIRNVERRRFMKGKKMTDLFSIKSETGEETWGYSYNKDWKDYYRYVYTPELGETYEKMFANIIRSYCGSKLVLTTIGNIGINLDKSKYPRMPDGHPTKEAHRMIYEDIH